MDTWTQLFDSVNTGLSIAGLVTATSMLAASIRKSRAQRDAPKDEDATRSLVDHANEKIRDVLATIEDIAQTERFADLKAIAAAPAMLAGAPTDHAHARVFMSTGRTFNADDENNFTVMIMGAGGSQVFSFVSGMYQSDIIDAINEYTPMTSAVASMDKVDPNLVKIRSLTPGEHAFVGAFRLHGMYHSILDHNRENPCDSHVDYGEIITSDPIR